MEENRMNGLSIHRGKTILHIFDSNIDKEQYESIIFLLEGIEETIEQERRDDL